jgi:two-component sensor histidine kinase
MDPTFDPYQALIELNDRCNIMAEAHNNLARDYQLQQVEFSVALDELHKLQKSHLALTEFVMVTLNASKHLLDK